MNERNAAWQDFDYPLAVGQEVCHQLMSDIRKKIWLIMNNIYIDAAGGGTEDPEESESSRFSNLDNANPPSGVYGDTSQAGWWGRNGDFRAGTAFADWDATGLDTALRRGPDYINIWHNEAWGNSIGGAGVSDYNIKGASLGHTSPGKSEIWFEDIQINSYATGEETVAGNLKIGCPVLIAGVTGDAGNAINGYWRIKSATPETISSTDYIKVELEDLHGDNDLILGEDFGHPEGSTYSSSGDGECNFGGDWYMWCPRLGNPTGNISFASDAMMKHVCTNNARGDGEKRPPDGGILSADESGYWCRTVNPYVYHHYDANAHRWIGFAQRRSSVNYFTVFESWRMLPIDTDPKEQVPPYWTDDKEMTEHQIAGNKVEVQREHFTDWDVMLASQGSQSHLRTSPSNLVRTTDRTTPRIHWASTGQYAWGRFPVMSDNSKWHKQRTIWQMSKLNSRCIWPWIELMCERAFVDEVNTTYKTNWLEENRLVVDPVHGSSTYETLWWTTSWNLAGYRPDYNNTQPRFDYLYSRFWGENGSGLEKILSDLGDYDWWFDATNKYVPYPIKHNWGNIYHSQQNNHDSPPETGPTAAEWEHPTPAGTWRKIPKWSFGYVDGDTATDPGVTGFMRDKESGTPNGSEIVNYEDEMHGGAGIGSSENWNFCSLYANAVPAVGEFGNYATNLKTRHGEVHTHDSVFYWEKVYLILNLMLDVMDQLKYLDMTPAIGITTQDGDLWMSGDLGAELTLEDYLAKFQKWMVEAWDPDIANWTPSGGWSGLYVRYGIYRDTIPDPDEYNDDNIDYGVYKERAFGFSGFNRIYGLSHMYLSVKIPHMLVDTDPFRAAEVAGINGEIITQETFASNLDLYKILDVSEIVSTTSEIEWAKVWLNNAFRDPVFDGFSRWELTITCLVTIQVVGNISVIGEIDWNLFPDNIWIRDQTYEKRFLTGVNDTNPPGYEPISLYKKPILFDANRPPNDTVNECYTWPNYIAAWTLKMDSILMEDVENHGVEYKFDGTGGSGTKKAVDFGVTYQASRFHNIVLDMDIATLPGDADDLEEALDNGIKWGWAFAVTAKDNAASYGSGQSDNTTNISEALEVCAEDGTIVPPYALWEQVPTISGSDVDMEIKEAFGPFGDRPCEYLFTTIDSTWTRSWSTDVEAVHTGGASAGKTYICYARTITGNIITLVSIGLGAV